MDWSCHWAPLMKVWLLLPCYFQSGNTHTGRAPPAPSLTDQVFPGLSLSSYVTCSKSLFICVVLHWTCSSKSMSHLSMPHLCWGIQNWTQYSRMFLTSAEQTERIICLCLLMILCLIQPRRLLVFFAMRVHHWLLVSFCSLGPLGTVLQFHFPGSWLQPVLVHGAVPSQWQDLAFFFI